MKTAVSLPDHVFDAADQLAKRLGVSRSELYATAVAEFVAKHRSSDVTESPRRRSRYRRGTDAEQRETGAGTLGPLQGVVIERGEVWWADLDEARGSEPGFRRPILIVQSDAFNRSRIRTVVAIVLTSDLRLVAAPGNVLVPPRRPDSHGTHAPTSRRS